MLKERVCDICYTKHNNEDIELAKKNYLREVASWAVDLDQKCKELQQIVITKEIEKEKLIFDVESNTKNMQSQLAELEKEVDDMKFISQSKNNEKKYLEEGIKKRNEIYHKSCQKLQDLENNISVLEMGLQMQKQNIELRLQRNDKLKNHLDEINECTHNLESGNTNDQTVVQAETLIQKSISFKGD